MDNDNKFDEVSQTKSKSQVKREMVELQVLGEKLTHLNQGQLQKLDLPTLLYQAIQEANKISSRGGKRRQLQYIGRLMRNIEDPSYIREFFQQLEQKDQRNIAFFHILESWRERLISENNQTMTEFIQIFPHCDRQHLRQLIQNAKKEREIGNPVGASKTLFRYLRELQEYKLEEDEV